MSEFLSINISGQDFNFRTRKQLEDWWAKEKVHWTWLWPKAPIQEIAGLTNAAATLNSRIDNQEGAENIWASLDNFFNSGNPHVALSSSEEGERCLRIVDEIGVAAASWYLLVEQPPNHRNHLLQQNINALVDYIRASSVAHIGPNTDKGVLAQERRSYHAAVAKLEQNVRDFEGDSNKFAADRFRQIRTWKRGFVSRFRDSLNQAKHEFEISRDAAIASLAETEDLYRKQMALKAPVEYWKAKAKVHGKWEVLWAVLMIAYFAVAAWAIYRIAEIAAGYLLKVPGLEHATPIYIIVSGASIAATTLIFWLGRLVSKLFLSEHHLRADCSEKAVMTEAFLAMETRETFSSEERAVILASIFRSSPDGIVKDDGPGDLGVHAALSKAVMR